MRGVGPGLAVCAPAGATMERLSPATKAVVRMRMRGGSMMPPGVSGQAPGGDACRSHRPLSRLCLEWANLRRPLPWATQSVGMGGNAPVTSYVVSRPIRRACRGSPLNGVARKVATNPRASSVVCMRAPMATTCASLCSLASRAGPPTTPAPADAPHLVRRHLLAVAGAADHHAERLDAGGLVRSDAGGCAHAVHGVVVVGDRALRAVVHRFVAVGDEPIDEQGLQFPARMIRAQAHAHVASVPRRPSVAGRYRRL